MLCGHVSIGHLIDINNFGDVVRINYCAIFRTISILKIAKLISLDYSATLLLFSSFSVGYGKLVFCFFVWLSR